MRAITTQSDLEWNFCSKTVRGRPCVNKARYKGGATCCSCANREANAKNPGLAAKRWKNWAEKNPEKNKAKQQRYYYKNQEIEKSRSWLYRYNNPEKVKEYNEKVHNPRRRAKREAERAIRAKEST